MSYKPTITFFCIAVTLSLVSADLQAQQIFERKAVEVSNLGISFTNVGTVGRPNVRTVPLGPPSMEFPRGSGTEHLFEAGIWLGAQVGGETRVTTSSITTSGGYSQGAPGFEITNDGDLFFERSSLENNPNFSPEAISHQDLVTRYTDRNATIGNQVISGHVPLNADITFESYNWNFGFTEGLTIVRYDITNRGNDIWNNFYFGLYSDLVTRNINAPNVETGSAFFNKGGMGWLDSLYALYVFDRGSFDFPRLNTHAATAIIGTEYRGVDFHPRNAEEVQQAGLQPPMVQPAFWLFGAGAGDFIRPSDDLDRYSRMALPWPLETHREALRNDGYTGGGNFIQLNSIGPFPQVDPGETITIYVTFVAALMPNEFQSLVPGNVPDVNDLDNDESRANLTESIGWAYRLYDGSENEDGTQTRFLVPEPPTTPNMRIELDSGIASIYWDDSAEASIDPVTGEADFAGYRLYRTQLGDDLRGTITTNAQMLREWDVEGKNVGFNTGFNEVKLDNPVTFPGDPVAYTYRFDVPNLLSGWQYLFSVTAFDEGDDRTPPLETSINANAIRVFPGTPVNANFGSDDEEFKVGVYPNPYRINAAWDGSSPFTRKIMFYNLPSKAQIRVYTLSGEIVARLDHDAATYTGGDARWFRDFAGSTRLMPGGEHAWDLLTAANQNLTTGLYLYTVRDLDSGNIQRGRFAIIK